MPAPSTTECDIKVTGELAMIALDEGVKVGTFYWTIHKTVVCVVESNGVKALGIDKTPARAIKTAAAKLFGGL